MKMGSNLPCASYEQQILAEIIWRGGFSAQATESRGGLNWSKVEGMMNDGY